MLRIYIVWFLETKNVKFESNIKFEFVYIPIGKLWTRDKEPYAF